MTLENALEKLFHGLVRKELGGVAIKLRATVAGVPDRLVMLPGGRLILVELKTDDGELRPIQRVWHAKAAKLGTEVVTLSGSKEIRAWIEEQKHV